MLARTKPRACLVSLLASNMLQSGASCPSPAQATFRFVKQTDTGGEFIGAAAARNRALAEQPNTCRSGSVARSPGEQAANFAFATSVRTMNGQCGRVRKLQGQLRQCGQIDWRTGTRQASIVQVAGLDAGIRLPPVVPRMIPAQLPKTAPPKAAPPPHPSSTTAVAPEHPA